MPDDELERPDFLFWLGHPASVGDRVTLEPDEAHHLLRVVRRRVGSPVTLADGAGHWLDGVVVEAGGRSARVEVRAVRPSPADPVRDLHLGFPPLRPARTELLFEKCTELGVARFTPLRSARARPTGDRHGRWDRVVRTAAMQSLRSSVPEVMPLTDLESWLSSLDRDARRWVARPGGGEAAEARTPREVALVGPEGDFTPSEWALLEGAGFHPVDLGRGRLRAETAAIALVSRLSVD